MTEQEQIEKMAKLIQAEYKQWLDTTGVIPEGTTYYAECLGCAIDCAKALYEEGYRKVPDGAVVLTPEERDEEMKATNEILAARDDLKEKVESLKSEKEGWKMRYSDSGQKNKKLSIKNAQLKAENEQLKAKLEKNPLAIKQKIMEEDDYELTEREQATLFLDRMGSDLDLLHDMVENLDELLGKGIDEYIMGIDGVEGLKDMWERSAVREFADKLKTQLEEKDQHYIDMYDWNAHSAVTDCENEVDELLKEYE